MSASFPGHRQDADASLEPGDYQKTPDGWRLCDPYGFEATLPADQVQENADGTITVRPWPPGGIPHGSWEGSLDSGTWESTP